MGGESFPNVIEALQSMEKSDVLTFLHSVGFYEAINTIYQGTITLTSLKTDTLNGKLGRVVATPPSGFKPREFRIAVRLANRWVSISPLNIDFPPLSPTELALKAKVSRIPSLKFSFTQKVLDEDVAQVILPYLSHVDLIATVCTCKNFHEIFHYRI